MFSKIKALTKIFIKDFYQSTKLVNKETKKINIKSIYFWIFIIIAISMIYISYKSINLCTSIGAPEIFIRFFMIFLVILLMMQITLILTNVIFFSKDLENVLPLPLKAIEIMIAKFNTVLFMSYMVEIICAVVPLILYGFMNYTSSSYFIWMILLLLLLPIMFISVIGLFAIIFMKIFAFIKNKNFLQNLINIILIIFLFIIENVLIQNINVTEEKNSLLLLLIKILTDLTAIEKIKSFLLLLVLNILSVLIFIFIGKTSYLKLILRTTTETTRRKKFNRRKTIEIKDRKTKLGREYIKKDFKMLFKQPIFFMQTVFPIFMLLVSLIFIANVLIPTLDLILEENETLKEIMSSLSFNTEMICIILGLLQCMFSMSSISITAISREGKNAVFMKYIPVDYYKQFLYKNVIQVILNIIVAITLLGIIYCYIPQIGLINIILMFIISIFINLINSYLMLVVDLKRPYLNWNSEHSVVKKNDNKSFQYALTIIMILIYMYLSNIFKEINVSVTLIIEIMIFSIIFIIIDRIIKHKSKKMFDKII